MRSYLDWGGTSKRPQMLITDWREVPTWSEFEILKARFEKLGVPVELADPRDLQFDGKQLTANGKKIDLVYRRVLMNDIVTRAAECKALVDAVAANENARCLRRSVVGDRPAPVAILGAEWSLSASDDPCGAMSQFVKWPGQEQPKC